MKFKLLLLVLSVVFATSCVAQSPFKKRPNLASAFNENLRLNGVSSVSVLDSTFNMWRFSGATGYSYPDGNVQAGLGFGIVHTKYTYATQSYYDDWSISGYVWAGGNVTPKTVSDIAKVSILAGFINGAVAVGPYYSIGPKVLDASGKSISQIGVMVSTTLKFNP